MALLLAEIVAGGIVFIFFTPLWNEVRPGFFKLTGSVILTLSIGDWASMSSSVLSGSHAGHLSLRLVEALSLMTLVWLILMFAGRLRVARFLGYLSAALSVALLGALSGTASGSRSFALFQLLVGAAFVGAVLDGLLLGHWYLTDRGLTRTPINRASLILIVATCVKALAVLMGGFQPTEGSAAFNPLMTSAGLAPWVSLGMVAATGMIAVMIKLTLKGSRASAVQAATGFFYLAVLTAFTAELATLVRFLPA
jgi:hypothetical protein